MPFSTFSEKTSAKPISVLARLDVCVCVFLGVCVWVGVGV